MTPGDIVTFHATVSRTGSGSVELGIVYAGTPLVFVDSEVEYFSGTKTISLTVKITHEGWHYIRIRNTSASGNVTFSSNINMWHRSRVDNNALIRCSPELWSSLGTTAQARAYLSERFALATNGFDEFGIFFHAMPPAQDTDLNGSDCPRGNNNVCSGSCPTPCESNHHKSVERLLKIRPNVPAYRFVVRTVGHKLCDPRSHDGDIEGAAWRPTQHNPSKRDSLASTAGTNANLTLQMLIQHELSHNLNAQDHTGTTTCIMNVTRVNGVFTRMALNKWCSTCSSAILAYRQQL